MVGELLKGCVGDEVEDDGEGAILEADDHGHVHVVRQLLQKVCRLLESDPDVSCIVKIDAVVVVLLPDKDIVDIRGNQGVNTHQVLYSCTLHNTLINRVQVSSTCIYPSEICVSITPMRPSTITKTLLRLPGATLTKVPSTPSKDPPMILTFVPFARSTSSGERYWSFSLWVLQTEMNWSI